LPSESYLAEQMGCIDPDAIHQARAHLQRRLAAELRADLLATWQRHTDAGPYRFKPEAVGRRSLKNTCLAYLALLEEPVFTDICINQATEARSMTDVLAALNILANLEGPQGEAPMAAFYERWQKDPLVVDKWFTLQATSGRTDTGGRVRSLLRHPAFHLRNPNRVRSLLGVFCQANPYHFHDVTGSGYALLGHYVREIDAFNPQLAARLVAAFNHWRRYDEKRQHMMREQLELILERPGVSRDVAEVVRKSLGWMVSEG
jgi:aminopeptidase N